MSKSPIGPDAENVLGSGATVDDEGESRIAGLPLYAWVVLAVVLAIPAGLLWGDGATRLELLPIVILRADRARRAAGCAGDLECDRHQ